MVKEKPLGPSDRRYFISVETDFFDHPKTLAIGPELGFAVLASWAYCHKQLTDGVLPEQAAKQILPHKRDRDRLVKHGWWEEQKGGYLIHDYLKHQPSRSTMRQKSDAARNAAGIRWSVKANASSDAERIGRDSKIARGGGRGLAGNRPVTDRQIGKQIASKQAKSEPLSQAVTSRNESGHMPGKANESRGSDAERNAERNAEWHADVELEPELDVPTGSIDPVPSTTRARDPEPLPEEPVGPRSRRATGSVDPGVRREARRSPGLRHVGQVIREGSG